MSFSRIRKGDAQSLDFYRCLLLPLLLNCLIPSTDAATTEHSVISHHTPGFSAADGVTSSHHLEGLLTKENEAQQTPPAVVHSANDKDAGDAQLLLWEGIKKDDPEQIVLAQLQGADLNAKRELDQMTPLGVAARDYRLEAVKALLRLGAGVDVTGGAWIATPLHYASYCGHLKVVIELVAAGANVRARDVDGDTPHHNADHYGHIDVKTYLQAVLFRDYDA